MSNIELSIWSALLGALLTFLGAAFVDAVRNPNVASWRALFFIVVVGSSAMVMSGWVEEMAQIQDSHWLLPAKVTLGPMSGSLALLYLGIWFGKLTQDPWLDRLIHWGSLLQCVAAVVLLASAVMWPAHDTLLLSLAFAVNVVSVLMALSACARGVALGDQLAVIMASGCVCLGVMVVGLYVKGLGWASSYLLWALTAMCTAAYFLITTVLTIQRNRQLRVNRKMADGVAQSDETTGLPVGGMLLSRIDDVIWRSMRMDCECAVMAIWVDNVFAFHDEVDRSVEYEIRRIVTARIRRAIGFRHALGLQQSRCFVAGISAVAERLALIQKVQNMLNFLQRPMQVGLMMGKAQQFEPKIGIGLVFVGLGHMTDPLSAVDHAQSLAKRALKEPLRMLHEEARPSSSTSSNISSPASG